jgi:hypothetical protein
VHVKHPLHKRVFGQFNTNCIPRSQSFSLVEPVPRLKHKTSRQ